jgi:putative DNA primase/helicase
MFYNGKICGLQIIDVDGNKKFLTGQRTNDAQHVIGSGKLQIWCEGYATGIAIRMAAAALKIDCAIHITFSAGNMGRMASAGIVIADNDESLTGERVAKETGLPYFMPEQTGWDFCDLWQSKGTFVSSQILRKFLIGVK